MQRKDIQTEEVVRFYQNGLIGREIAEKLGCSVTLVQRRLTKAGIKMRSSNDRITIPIDKHVLEEMYWVKKMHPVAIGKVFGVHKMTVTKKMLEFGIPFRTKSQARIGKFNPLYGVGHSEETKNKLSQQFIDGRRKVSLQNQYGNPTKYKETVYRSSWEAGVAFYLDTRLISYEYEYRSFPYPAEYGRIRSYTPDFYLPNTDTYLEVKGVFREKDLYKVNSVIATQGIKIDFWDGPKLVELGVISPAGKVIIGLDVIHKVITPLKEDE